MWSNRCGSHTTLLLNISVCWTQIFCDFDNINYADENSPVVHTVILCCICESHEIPSAGVPWCPSSTLINLLLQILTLRSTCGSGIVLWVGKCSAAAWCIVVGHLQCLSAFFDHHLLQSASPDLNTRDHRRWFFWYIPNHLHIVCGFLHDRRRELTVSNNYRMKM